MANDKPRDPNATLPKLPPRPIPVVKTSVTPDNTKKANYAGAGKKLDR